MLMLLMAMPLFTIAMGDSCMFILFFQLQPDADELALHYCDWLHGT